MSEKRDTTCKNPTMSARKCDLMRIAFLFKLIMIAILFSLCEGLCGNGVIEDQEECDCGLLADCKDPCCRELVCKLKDGAQCSNLDPCCKNCKFKKKKEMCRYAKNECDLPEYCTGESSSCPQNIFHRDGKKCSQEKGYCSKGYCQTHETQCQLIYKTQQVTSAPPECYMALNSIGNERGNCGSHQPCSGDDAFCGTLQCIATNGTTTTFTGIGVAIPAQGDQPTNANQQLLTNCPTFSSNFPLVQDMTKCGQNKICLNQRCVNLSAVFNLRVKCPSSETDVECSGRGDCTSRFNCLCQEGFGGPDCSQPEEIVDVKETASTKAPVEFPVTRTESQGIMTHKMPDEVEDTNYALGMIFAIVVVSVSIVCFMCALIYCYLFSSPIAKAKESLDSHADDYSNEDNSMQHFQSLTHAPEKQADTCSAQIRQEVVSPEFVGQPVKANAAATATGNQRPKIKNETTNLHPGHDTVEIHDSVGNDAHLAPALTVQLEAFKLAATAKLDKS